MSNHIKELAQRVINNYAAGMSGGDDEQFDALIELGNRAEAIVEMCELAGLPSFQHKVSGSAYVKIGDARLQANEPVSDGCVLTLYQGEDGQFWVRPPDEFDDGRFLALPGKFDDTATIELKLRSRTGYMAESMHKAITPNQYRQVVSALHNSLKEVTPEIEEKLARLEGLDK